MEPHEQPPAVVRSDADLATLIAAGKALHESLKRDEKSALDHAVELGGILARIKQTCPHGTWLSILNDMGIAQQRASDYMRVVKLPASVISSCTSLRDALRQLGPDPDAPKTPLRVVADDEGTDRPSTPPGGTPAADDPTRRASVTIKSVDRPQPDFTAMKVITPAGRPEPAAVKPNAGTPAAELSESEWVRVISWESAQALDHLCTYIEGCRKVGRLLLAARQSRPEVDGALVKAGLDRDLATLCLAVHDSKGLSTSAEIDKWQTEVLNSLLQHGRPRAS
jgi:hypothetical protein